MGNIHDLEEIECRVTYEEQGGMSYAGEFTKFDGWTFEVSLCHPDLNEGNDCGACLNEHITGASLLENGEPYYSCPDDDYDGYNPALSEIHHEMFAQLDNHFDERFARRRIEQPIKAPSADIRSAIIEKDVEQLSGENANDNRPVYDIDL